jgi:hypothetical protein
MDSFRFWNLVVDLKYCFVACDQHSNHPSIEITEPVSILNEAARVGPVISGLLSAAARQTCRFVLRYRILRFVTIIQHERPLGDGSKTDIQRSFEQESGRDSAFRSAAAD